MEAWSLSSVFMIALASEMWEIPQKGFSELIRFVFQQNHLQREQDSIRLPSSFSENSGLEPRLDLRTVVQSKERVAAANSKPRGHGKVCITLSIRMIKFSYLYRCTFWAEFGLSGIIFDIHDFVSKHFEMDYFKFWFVTKLNSNFFIL